LRLVDTVEKGPFMLPSEGSIEAFVNWYYETAAVYSMVMAFDENNEPVGVCAVFRDKQFESLGHVALAVRGNYSTLNLREALLEAIVETLGGKLHTLEAQTCNTNVALIFAYQVMGFVQYELPGELPDGKGGLTSRIVLYTHLTDKAKTAAVFD
jgi:GNAT superfamily N-acetyltransferase